MMIPFCWFPRGWAFLWKSHFALPPPLPSRALAAKDVRAGARTGTGGRAAAHPTLFVSWVLMEGKGQAPPPKPPGDRCARE